MSVVFIKGKRVPGTVRISAGFGLGEEIGEEPFVALVVRDDRTNKELLEYRAAVSKLPEMIEAWLMAARAVNPDSELLRRVKVLPK